MSCFKDFRNRLQTLKNRLLKHNVDKNSCSEGRHQGKTDSGGIPVIRKLCYAVGGIPNPLTSVAISISLQIFLLDIVQMEPWHVSMILFVSRAWDAVTDPLVGYLTSRSKWTSIGKLTPWMVLSTPFGILSYLLQWFVPGGSMSQPLSMVWFLAAACLFETIMSCYNVPYISLTMFLGGNQRDRDSFTAYRMNAEMVAALLGSLVQGQVIAVYNKEKKVVCQQMINDTVQSTSSPQIGKLHDTQRAFLISALVMGALYFLCSLTHFLGVKEQQASLSSDCKVRPPFLTSLKMLICFIPYQRLVLGFVFSTFAIQMSWNNFALFSSNVAGLGAEFKFLPLSLLMSASLAVPVWQAVLLRIGKKNTVFIGLSIFIPAMIIIACIPTNLPAFVIICILLGFSVGAVFLLPWSMLPDVVDEFAVKHPSYKDLEPLFFSCYAFCQKLAGSLSAGISTLVLQFVGYRAGACYHGDGVATTLTVLFSPVPIAFQLIGMAIFYTYPINEGQRSQPQEPQTTVNSERGSLSSSLDQRQTVEELAVLEQPHGGVTPSSHHNTKTNASHKSNSSLRCYSHNKKCSARSSAHSDVTERPPAGYSRPESVSQSDINPHLTGQKLERVRSQQRSDRQGRDCRSKVRPKDLWI